jgi:hypothetical protein
MSAYTANMNAPTKAMSYNIAPGTLLLAFTAYPKLYSNLPTK